MIGTWVALSLCTALLWQVYAMTDGTTPNPQKISDNNAMDDRQKIDILPQMMVLNRLRANYDRVIREYTEETPSADTLKWSRTKTGEEIVATLRGLLAYRKDLVNLPADNLIYQLQVRRAQAILSYRQASSIHTQYDAVLSALMRLRSIIYNRWRHSENDPTKEKIDALIVEEIIAGAQAGLHAQAFALCEQWTDESTETQGKIERLEGFRPLFDGKDEQSMVDFLILRYRDLDKVMELREKVLSFAPEPGTEEAWAKAEHILLHTYRTLRQRVTAASYKERIRRAEESLLAPEGALIFKDYDAKAASITVEVVAIVHGKAKVKRYKSGGEGSDGKEPLPGEQRLLTPSANRVVRERFEDTFPGAGHYRYELTSDASTERLSSKVFTHSRLKITGQEYEDRCVVFATDPLDGNPIGGLKAGLYDRSEKKLLGTLVFDAKGCIVIPKRKEDSYLLVKDNRIPEGSHKIYINQKYTPLPRTETRKTVEFYTDRPVYRYGQTVKVGLVFYKDKPKGMEVVPNHSDVLTVYAVADGKNVKLATFPVTTTANGAAELSYTLPDDEGYTNFFLSIKGEYESRHYLNVQSYKLQHLQVHIDSIPSGYVIGKPLRIHGRVTDFNGLPTSARVMISYDVASARSTLSHEVGESGIFAVETSPISELKQYYMDHLEVSAIDALGRIATTSLAMHKDTTDLPLSASALVSDLRLDKEDFTLDTSTQPYTHLPLGDLTKYKVFAYLKDNQGKETRLGELPIKGSKAFSIPSIKSGEYILGLRAIDGYRKPVMSEKNKILIYGRKAKQPPVPMTLWVQPYCPKDSDKKDIVLSISGSYDTYVSIFVEEESDLVYHDIIPIRKGLRTVRIPRSILKGGAINIRLSTLRHGEAFNETVTIGPEMTNTTRSIAIEPASETKKTFIPGAEVRRQYVITEGGKPLTNAAVFVTVFDKAVLDVDGGRGFWSMINPLYDTDHYVLYSEPMMSLAKGENVRLSSAVALRGASEEAKGDAFGGLQTRADFSETAYFTALLRTNAKGEVEYKYSLPDTQTKYVEKVFVFDKTLKHQSIEDFEFDVFAPVSVEVNLPRYLTRGDTMAGEILLRNTQKNALPITYRIMLGDRELSSGTQTVQGERSSTVGFELAPEHLSGDSLIITAQIVAEGYSDAIKRKIPLRSDMSVYGIAVPFSLYKERQAVLELPKMDKLDSTPNLFAYFNPTHLILTRLAQEYTMAMERKVDHLSIYGALHHFVIFANISDLFRRHPEIRNTLVEALPTLREAAKTSPDIDLDADRGHFMSQRLTDPRTLAYFYDFVTDTKRLSDYLALLTKKIKTSIHPDGGWCFAREYPSSWLTMYVLRMLGDVPESERLTRFSRELKDAFAYLDKEYRKDTSHPSLIDYALIRHAHGLGADTLDKDLALRLKKEADAARKGYRDYRVSRLLWYGEFTGIYGDAKHNEEVQTFIDDMSRYTLSDNEQVGFELYKQARDKGSPSEAVIALILRHKQGLFWDNTYAVEAVKLLLAHITPTQVDKGATLIIDGKASRLSDTERAMGAVTRRLDDVGSTLEISQGEGITTDFLCGGVVYHVTEPMAKVSPTGQHLQVSKEIFARRIGADGKTSIVPVSTARPALKGEKLIVRYTVKTTRDLSLITIQDDRPATSEPGYTLRGYKVADRVGWAYRRTERSDQLFIDYLPRGRHVFELEAIATTKGVFVYGPAEIRSYYAPEFQGNSAGGALSVTRQKRD